MGVMEWWYFFDPNCMRQLTEFIIEKQESYDLIST